MTDEQYIISERQAKCLELEISKEIVDSLRTNKLSEHDREMRENIAKEIESGNSYNAYKKQAEILHIRTNESQIFHLGWLKGLFYIVESLRGKSEEPK